VASFVSMPLAEPSYQANTAGARLAGEESEPEDVDHVYTSSYLRDDNRPVLGDWVPKRVATADAEALPGDRPPGRVSSSDARGSDGRTR
jgi:hypothetical protein